MQTIERSGTYFRVAKPEWTNPLDPAYSKEVGGRWNPPGEFGALYFSRTLVVAAANARWQHRNRAIRLFDLRPNSRPVLLTVTIPRAHPLDVVTAKGVRALRLPASYPYGVGHDRCHPIARRAMKAGIPGVACRSAAECTLAEWIGEELAWFDNQEPPMEAAPRLLFADWYPDSIP